MTVRNVLMILFAAFGIGATAGCTTDAPEALPTQASAGDTDDLMDGTEVPPP